MSKQQASYRNIFKATSIFGGVQLFNIVISIARSKLVAVLLGPAGMGILSLYTTTIGLVAAFTNFGLGTSAVKNVAAANELGNEYELGKTVAVFRRLVWFTGSLGFLLTLIFAPFLSDLAFGNKSNTLGFIVLSITLLLTQLSAGNNVILQGMRKLQYMAKAAMFGSIFGFIFSIPLYYFFAEKGIVPAILITAVLAFLLEWYYAKKVKIPKMKFSRDTLATQGKEMLKMGFLMSVTSLITIGAAYVVRVFISSSGGLTDVGLFTAGFSIVNTYVGMVFVAMATDYYPRLAALANDDEKCKEAINQQAEIATLILAPILMILLVFVKFGVIFLYSLEFINVVDMIHWATLGIFFKALSWSIAFIFLAKSASKTFFWNELVSSLYMLLFNMIGYKYGGLTGLGISFLISYFVYFLQVLLVSKLLYKFSINKALLKIFIFQFLIAVICFGIVSLFNKTIAYSLGTALILSSSVYSWRELDKRLGIKSVIFNILNKNKST